MNYFRFKHWLFLATVMIFCFAVYAQKKDSLYITLYHLNSPSLLYNVPDTIFQQLGTNAKDIKLPIGTIFYKNYYQKGLSRTDIWFEDKPGIRFVEREDKSCFIFSRMKDTALFLYEGNKLAENYTYQLPKLLKKNESKTIKGYQCDAYMYDDSATKVIVWFTKALPYQISPGIYYKKLGAVVQIDYALPDVSWSLELVSFETAMAEIDFKKGLPKSSNDERKTHFIFKK